MLAGPHLLRRRIGVDQPMLAPQVDVVAGPPAAQGRQVMRRQAGDRLARIGFGMEEAAVPAPFEIGDAIGEDASGMHDVAKAVRNIAEILADHDQAALAW